MADDTGAITDAKESATLPVSSTSIEERKEFEEGKRKYELQRDQQQLGLIGKVLGGGHSPNNVAGGAVLLALLGIIGLGVAEIFSTVAQANSTVLIRIFESLQAVVLAGIGYMFGRGGQPK